MVENGSAAALRVDAADWPGVQRAARDLQADVNRVTGVTPALNTAAFNTAAQNAKAGCPVSKVLNAKITMNAKLG